MARRPGMGPKRHSKATASAFILAAGLVLTSGRTWVPGFGVRELGQGHMCSQGLWLDSYCAHGMRSTEPDLLAQITAMGPPPWAFLPPWVQILAPFVIIIVLGAVMPIFFGRAPFGAPRGADLSEWLKQRSIEVEVTKSDRQRPDP
ncbi:unnamed protein product [Symbiodinium natans]|uniref:Uncharacterized protein n=1 Tax=Symbiodinium natans TaxID=878477 RepID=A0A812KYD2_9DINO|nr:unnamed protein product [Symbiodinium natans]